MFYHLRFNKQPARLRKLFSGPQQKRSQDLTTGVEQRYCYGGGGVVISADLLLSFPRHRNPGTGRLNHYGLSSAVLAQRVRGGVKTEHSCFCPQGPPPPGRLEESKGFLILLNGMLFTNYVHKLHYLCYSQKLFRTENVLWKIRLWEGRKMRWWNPTILIIMQSNHSVKLIKGGEGFLCLSESNGEKKHDLMTFVRKWRGCSLCAV